MEKARQKYIIILVKYGTLFLTIYIILKRLQKRRNMISIILIIDPSRCLQTINRDKANSLKI